MTDEDAWADLLTKALDPRARTLVLAAKARYHARVAAGELAETALAAEFAGLSAKLATTITDVRNATARLNAAANRAGRRKAGKGKRR